MERINDSPRKWSTGGVSPSAVDVHGCIAGLTAPAYGQQIIETTEDIVCSSCQIATGGSIPLEGTFEFGSIEEVASVVRRGSDGRFFVVSAPDRVDVYSSSGAATGTTIGKRGNGPGEFQRVGRILTGRNTLHVYDPLLRRRTDFDLRSGTVSRTVPLPPHLHSVVFPDGTTVLSGPVRTREAAGQPLHVYSPDGSWKRSFGFQDAFLRPDLEILLYYAVYRAGDSTFWAVPRNEHRVELAR